jgi:hypothetical protein
MKEKLTLDEIELLYSSREISETTYKLLLETYIPSVFIERNVHDPDNPDQLIKLRDYQKIALDSDSHIKVLLFGRQTGKSVTLFADMAYHGMNKLYKNKTLLFFAPNKVHINNVLGDKVYKTFISNEDMKRYIVSKKNDLYYEIVFTNGTVIRGIAVNQNPIGARSHTGDIIYIDEAQYIEQEAYNALSGVSLSRPDAYWWYSSTPGISSGMFYDMCNSDLSEVFYVPATLIPNWDKNAEKKARALYPIESVYQAEVMARFISPESSIFPSYAVDLAINKGYMEKNGVKIPYDSNTWMERFPNTGIFSIGVDWNGVSNGVHIVVMSKIDGNFVEVEKVIIQAVNFIQHKAIDKIIELIVKYRPLIVCVDKGFGGSQIEDLLLRGIKDPTLHIKEILKPVGFNDQLETRDPESGIIVNKQTKTYMIMETVRLFTEERVILMPEESEKFMLGDQLKAYSIGSILINGALNFKTKESDHTLDAFCLAVFGLLEKTEHILDKGNILSTIDAGKNVTILNNGPNVNSIIDNIINSMMETSPDIDGDALYDEIASSWFNNIKVIQRSRIEPNTINKIAQTSKRNRL